MWIIFNKKMIKTFLKEVVVIIVGKQAEDIIDMLDGNKYINEFIIAKKLGITINQTRNILYKISDHGLISSIRKKDKRKGWYTYFWKIEVLKSLEFLSDLINKRVDQLKYQIKSRETKEFYVCEQCNVEVSAENALLREFTCNECGQIYTLKDNTRMLRELKREVEKLEGKLKLVQVEIVKEQEKVDKQRAREIKKEVAEKAKKRAVAAAKRKATRKKLEKQAGKSIKKKAVKKKPVKKKKILKKKLVKKKIAKKKVLVKKKVLKRKPAKKKIVRHLAYPKARNSGAKKKPVKKTKSKKKKK